MEKDNIQNIAQDSKEAAVNKQGKPIYITGFEAWSSNPVRGQRNKLERAIIPTEIPALDELFLPDQNEGTKTLHSDEDNPKVGKNTRKMVEEEVGRNRRKTLGELLYGQSDPKIIMQQVKYPKNIVKTESEKDIKMAPTHEDESSRIAPNIIQEIIPMEEEFSYQISSQFMNESVYNSEEEKKEIELDHHGRNIDTEQGFIPSELPEHLSGIPGFPKIDRTIKSLPRRDTILNRSSSPKVEEFLEFCDPTEELPECIEIIKEELDCEMCTNRTKNTEQPLITTVRVCLKCRRSFIKTMKHMVFKWCIRTIFFLMLCTIIILACFLAVLSPKCSDLKKEYGVLEDKYNHTIGVLLSGKNEITEKKGHISSLFSLFQDLEKCKEKVPDQKIKACEDSMQQMKQDITSSIQHTVEVHQTYKGIVDQIDDWIDKKLIVLPEIGPINIPIKDIEFTPTNIAKIEHQGKTIKYLKDYINVMNMKILSSHMKNVAIINEKKSYKTETEQLKLNAAQLRQIINNLKDDFYNGYKFLKDGIGIFHKEISYHFTRFPPKTPLYKNSQINSMIDLANKENNLIIKENNYIESTQLSKSIFPQIMGKIIQFANLIDNLYSAYIQLKYKQEINSLQNGILKNKIDHLSKEHDHSVKLKWINEDLIQERIILKTRINKQNRELDIAKSNNQLLKQNIRSIILNFNHIRNIHVEYIHQMNFFERKLES